MSIDEQSVTETARQNNLQRRPRAANRHMFKSADVKTHVSNTAVTREENVKLETRPTNRIVQVSNFQNQNYNEQSAPGTYTDKLKSQSYVMRQMLFNSLKNYHNRLDQLPLSNDHAFLSMQLHYESLMNEKNSEYENRIYGLQNEIEELKDTINTEHSQNFRNSAVEKHAENEYKCLYEETAQDLDNALGALEDTRKEITALKNKNSQLEKIIEQIQETAEGEEEVEYDEEVEYEEVDDEELSKQYC